MPTRAPRCATTVAASPWTGTPPTSSPRSPPAPPAPAEHDQRAGRFRSVESPGGRRSSLARAPGVSRDHGLGCVHHRADGSGRGGWLLVGEPSRRLNHVRSLRSAERSGPGSRGFGVASCRPVQVGGDDDRRDEHVASSGLRSQRLKLRVREHPRRHPASSPDQPRSASGTLETLDSRRLLPGPRLRRIRHRPREHLIRDRQHRTLATGDRSETPTPHPAPASPTVGGRRRRSRQGLAPPGHRGRVDAPSRRRRVDRPSDRVDLRRHAQSSTPPGVRT